MAVTTQNSTQYAREVTVTTTKTPAPDAYGHSSKRYFSFTQSGVGDANSLVNLIRIPPGRFRMYCLDSAIEWDAFGAARTLDIGWTAYTAPDGTAVVADEDGIETAIDVSAAGIQNGLGDGVAAGTCRTIDFNSRDGVVIQAKVEAGTIPDATKLAGYFHLQGI